MENFVEHLLQHSFEIPPDSFILSDEKQEELRALIESARFESDAIEEIEFINPNNYTYVLDIFNQLFLIFSVDEMPVFLIPINSGSWRFMGPISNTIH